MAKLVQYDFPAVIRAAKQRSATERPVVCRLRGQSALMEVDDREAPVVAIVKRKEDRSKFRFCCGGLFSSVASFDRIGDLTGDGRFLRWPLVEQRLFLEASDALAGYREAEIWPEGARGILNRRRSMTPLFHEPMDKLVLKRSPWDDLGALPGPDDLNHTENSKADIEERLAYVDNLMTSSLLVHEGTVIVKVPEPCFSVTPYHIPVRRQAADVTGIISGARIDQGDISFYGQAARMPVLHSSFPGLYWGDMRDTCFPITELDQAREFADTLMADLAAKGERPNLLTDVEKVEIFDASAFTHDFRTSEFLRLADRIFYHGTRATRLPSRPKAFRRNMPEDFIEAILDFEAARNDEGCDLDQLEDALDATLSAVIGNRDELEALNVDTDSFRRAIGIGLDRWDERPIRIDTHTGLFGNWKV
jgi:hypothetical protein|nr:hypothetical protein [Neorhizobium tomejilense]